MTEPAPQVTPPASTPAPGNTPPPQVGGQPNAQPQQTPPAKPDQRNALPANETPPAQPNPNEPSTETPPADGYKIPDAYKDKPWAAKIKTEDDVWKQLENLNTAIGKKTVVPDFASATPAEITQFQNQWRVPEDRTAYTEGLKAPEGVPAAEGDMYKSIFFEAAVPPAVAQPLLDKITGVVEQAKKELVNPEGFAKTMTERFGPDAMKQDGPVGAVATIIAPHLNQADREVWDNMPNDQLGVVYNVIGRILDDYGATEGASAKALGAGKGGGGGSTVESLQTQLDTNNQKIKDLSKRPHTYEEKKELLDANNSLAVKLQAAQQKTKRR